MNEVVKEFYRFTKRKTWITIIFSILFYEFLLDKVISDLIVSLMGYYWTGTLTIIIISVFVLGVIIIFYDERRKRNNLMTPPTTQPINKTRNAGWCKAR